MRWNRWTKATSNAVRSLALLSFTTALMIAPDALTLGWRWS
jgi:hypothetical protein